MLALEFAARFPNRLERLIVQGAGTHFERTLIQQVAGVVLSRYPLPSDSTFVNQFFNVLFGSKPRSTTLFDFVTRQCWQTDQGVMAHRFHLLKQFDLSVRLDRVSRQDFDLGRRPRLSRFEAKPCAFSLRMKDGQLVQLAGCGLVAFVSGPDQVAEEVRRFS